MRNSLAIVKACPRRAPMSSSSACRSPIRWRMARRSSMRICACLPPGRIWRRPLPRARVSEGDTPRHRVDGLLQSDLRLRRRSFSRDAKAAGVDGMIIVDLPPEEDAELCLPALTAGLELHPAGDAHDRRQASPDRSPNTSGFVYYVSITGITGSAKPDFGKVAARSPASSATPSCRSRSVLACAPRGTPAPSPKAPMASWSARRWSMR